MSGASVDPWLAGVDGCAGGWAIALADRNFTTIALRHIKSRLAVEPMRELKRTVVDGGLPSWRERMKPFIDELARALEEREPSGDMNE